MDAASLIPGDEADDDVEIEEKWAKRTAATPSVFR